jgi:hypothetical protein
MKVIYNYLGVCSMVVCLLLMHSFLTGPIVKDVTLQFITDVFLILLTAILAIAMFICAAENKK